MNAEVSHIGWLGFIVLAVVMGSLFLIILTTILGRPRKPKVTLLVIGTIIGLFITVVAGIWIAGFTLLLLMG